MKMLLLGSVAAAALVTGSAMAADLPVKAPVYKAPPAVAPVSSWTGCYLGAHIGGGWGRKRWTNTSGLDEGTSNIDGVLGGGQVGCDYQTGSWVFGAEGDISWTGLRGGHRDPVLNFSDQVLNNEVRSLGTVTGRIGYTFERALLYVKGGGAWVNDKYWDVSDTRGNIANATETRTGWTVGGGVEYAFAPNWSAGLEYNYLNFGTNRVQLICPVCAAGYFFKDIKQDIQTVKLSLNYRFNWRP